ncbi:MAG: hypothetical protein IPG50_04225 [Myxococcales bacterium]|nr:hypothetical protein [Myxococcales bacterium]
MDKVPLWAVVLVIAAASPTLVRAFARELERRVRVRTEAIIARAKKDAGLG